jgi:hypothetical protein
MLPDKPRQHVHVDEAEFRRRIAVYLTQELPALADGDGVAEAVSRRVWPVVGRWQSERDGLTATLAWIGQRLQAEWPEVAASLSMEQTGSDTGWFPAPRKQPG